MKAVEPLLVRCASISDGREKAGYPRNLWAALFLSGRFIKLGLSLNTFPLPDMKLTHCLFLLMMCLFSLVGCKGQEESVSPIPEPDRPRSVASIGLVGEKRNVSVPTEAGLVLMGGGTDVDEAMQWMIARAKGGDVVVVRASGGAGYNAYLYGLGEVNSVETLLINSRARANDTAVANTVRDAEMLFIAGGAQGDYVSYWKNTEMEKALRYLIQEKKVPVGGTSAGCAILGEVIYDGLLGSIISDEALSNPYHPYMSLQKGDFLEHPQLKGLVTDTHYAQRNRQGRHMTMLARMIKDFGIDAPRGIGLDERTAICVSPNGTGLVLGTGDAYFLRRYPTASAPERIQSGQKLTWKAEDSAVEAHIVKGGAGANALFNLNNWQVVSGGRLELWSVDDGVLNRKTP